MALHCQHPWLSKRSAFTKARHSRCAPQTQNKYLELTQKGKLPALSPPRQQAQTHVMAMDAATRRNLELVQTLSGEFQAFLDDQIACGFLGAADRVQDGDRALRVLLGDGYRKRCTATRDGATILPHRVLDNTAHGNSATGIWITGDGAPGIVRRNSVFGSGSTDMQDDTLGCVGNTWSGNTFRIDVVAGVSNGGPAVPCLR